MMDEVDQVRARRREELQARLRTQKRRERLFLGGVVLALVLAIGIKVAVDLHGSRDETERAGHGDAGGASRVVIRGSRAERMRRVADERADFVLEDDRLFWTDGAARRYEVAEVQRRGALVLRTEPGALKVDPEVWRGGQHGPPPALDAMVQHVLDAGQPMTGAVLVGDGFMPLRIRSLGFQVVEGGLMGRDQGARSRGNAMRARASEQLQDATRAFLHALDDAPLDAGTRKATAEILRALPSKGGNFFSSLDPTITRRLIRHGWLRQVGSAADVTTMLEEAVEASVTPQPLERYAGPGGSWTRYEDVFGRELEVLVTSDGTWFSCPQPTPQWLGRAATRSVTVQLAPQGDPFADRIEPVAAHLEPYGGLWRRGGTLEVDAAAWQKAMKRRFGRQPNQPDNLFPPHMLLTNGYGDAVALVTQHGVVHPGRDASPAERKRFFDEAAKALPDVAHMDLVGEILYTYAWDTAEYDRPLLLGTEAYNGDIHQTADQTLQTCCGGIYRGDCDDLACFYHALTTHQGRNAHVMSLPHHLANAYAEQQPDGSWGVAVLHTGPPLWITARTLERAILKTYEHFESHESVDLGGLPFSLRFGEDAVRQRYMLPYEIFRDAEYARDLIEVQAAYRFHTYLTGIETMERILAKRKTTNAADHRETAHLLTWADRDADATPHFEQAFAAATTNASRVDAGLDWLGNLVDAGQHEAARTLAARLAKSIIPAFERELGHKLVQPWLRLARPLVHDDTLRSLGLALLAEHAAERVVPAFEAIEEVARRAGFDPRWLHYNGLPRSTTNVGGFVNLALIALGESQMGTDGVALEHRDTLDAMLRRWFDRIAFHTLHANASVLRLYGSLASYYEGTIGSKNLEKLVAKAGAASADDLRRARAPGRIQRAPSEFHLRMIKLTPGYHRARWWRGLVAEPADFDGKTTRRAIYAELAATDAAAQQGLGHHGDPNDILLARLALTFLDGRAKAATPILAEAAERRDPGLESAVVRLLTASAHRHAPEAWMALVTAWADTMGRTPDHLKLAWQVMRDDHPEHAVAAGRLALARHADRADFQRELAHLKQVALRKQAAAK